MTEPKFKVGDMVTIKGEIIVMKRDNDNDTYDYAVELPDSEILWAVESDLTPADETEETK